MKMRLINKMAIKSIICMTLLTVGQAQAALINFTVNAQIGSAAAGNSFGLTVGDIITASGQFDDTTMITGVFGDYFDFSSSVNNMSISFGNTDYTDAKEKDGGALMYFSNGIFDGISYVAAVDPTIPEFLSNGLVGGPFDVSGTDYTGYVDGTWQVDSYSDVSAVPVPAAIWLFGSGLIGLAGIGRRKNQYK